MKEFTSLQLKNHPLLTTKRLTIIPLSTADALELVQYQRDNYQQFQNFLPQPAPDYLEESFWQRKIWKSQTDWVNKTAYRFILRVDNQLSGIASITNLRGGAFQDGQLGYSLDRNFQQKGLMQEALKEVLHFLYTETQINRISALVMPNNLPSLRVLENLNFKNIGLIEEALLVQNTWKDHFLFSLTKKNYYST